MDGWVEDIWMDARSFAWTKIEAKSIENNVVYTIDGETNRSTKWHVERLLFLLFLNVLIGQRSLHRGVLKIHC